MDTQKRIIVWVSAIFVAGVVVAGAWSVATSSKTGAERPTPGFLSEKVGSSDWTKGSPSPIVTLVEYSDFQCPACGIYYPLIEKAVTEYGDRLAFTYRHFPLPQHKNALVASYASEAAGRQDNFWEMHQMIFEHQADWSDENNAAQVFERYAGELKLDLAQFKTDMASSEVSDKVAHDRATGVNSGVNSTPSFYLNGKKMQNPRGYEELKALIEYAIAHP